MTLASTNDIRLRVVLVSYEFTFSPFSGNGILARSLVKALLKQGCHITVWCCRPSDDCSSNNHHLEPPEISKDEAERLEIHAVTVEKWQRLDAESAWREFHWDSLQEIDMVGLTAALRTANIICTIDWTGGCAWRSLPYVWKNGYSSRPPLLYLNFRVYSSGVVDRRLRQFYDDMERQVLQDSTVTIVLSETDKRALCDLMQNTTTSGDVNSDGAAACPIEILLPPLRADMEELATRPLADLEQYLPSQVACVLQERIRNDKHQRRQRCFVTCVVRLSPEKDAIRFVRFVEATRSTLVDAGFTPLLAGAASDATYADKVKHQLRAVAPDSIVIEDFLPPTALAAILARTALNFHPCAYDAYGMTIVEAAAFGVPSVIASGGRVGASAIVGDGAAIQVDMPKVVPNNNGTQFDYGAELLPESSVDILRTVLCDDYDCLEATGAKAKTRALAWDEMAYGKKLMEHLRNSIALANS